MTGCCLKKNNQRDLLNGVKIRAESILGSNLIITKNSNCKHFCFLIVRGEIDLMVVRYLAVLILSVICATLVYVIILNQAEYVPYLIISGIMLTCYSIFLLPLQFILNRKPRMFNFKYLLLYTVFSFIAWLIMSVLFEPYNPLGSILASYEIYLFSVLFALIFWLWDSILVQIVAG
ncbi:UPF0715 family protein [Bacillus velezensis]|uniref:UPF0715 family protein n=2 Tax=Bacillus velezensis TaxID=492670 RepID=UPI0034A21001